MIDWDDPEVRKAYQETFFPYATRKLAQLRESKIRFAHYTSAENAMRIITGNCVWLRNTNVMNDFSEVQHGHACIMAAWHDSTIGGRLAQALNSIEAGLADAVLEGFTETERLRTLGSGLIDHIQKMTMAAIAMADMKVWAHRS